MANNPFALDFAQLLRVQGMPRAGGGSQSVVPAARIRVGGRVHRAGASQVRRKRTAGANGALVRQDQP